MKILQWLEAFSVFTLIFIGGIMFGQLDHYTLADAVHRLKKEDYCEKHYCYGIFGYTNEDAKN